MIKFGVYGVRSPLCSIKEMDAHLEKLEFTLKKIFPSKRIAIISKGIVQDKGLVVPIDDVEFYVLIVLSGGTEEHIKSVTTFKVKKPVILYTNRLNNSLAAAIEAKEYLLTRVPVFLIHENRAKNKNLKEFHKFEKIREKIVGKKIVTIGGASDWLVSSFVTEKRLNDFGIDLVEIKSDNFVEKFQKSSKIEREEDEKVSKFPLHETVTKGDVSKTMISMEVLKEMIKKEEILGLTIRCIDVIEDIGTSLCLPVSLLNDSGLPVACEGDLRSMMGMVLSTLVYDKPCFMGNLSDFDVETNLMTISHCTIATTLCEKVQLKTHMETDMGVAIHGKIPSMTKIVMFNLDVELKNCLLTKGVILKTPGESTLCRTQLIIKLESMKYAFKTFGNHQIVCFEENEEPIVDFLEYLGIKVFEI